MPVYVDVGVQRIQEYLTRTSGADERQLQKRRGASRMVTDATHASGFADLGLQPNRESYHIEGVAHLVSDTISAEAARDLALRAADRLRKALPHAYVQATWASGDTYSAAHPLLDAARQGRADPAVAGSLEFLPEVRDDPFGGRCKACGLASAGSAEQCPDCDARDRAGARQAADPAAAKAHPTPEEQVRAAASKVAGRTLAPVAHLTQLAKLPRDHSLKRNHVATVYADGNSVGQLFHGLSDRALAQRLSRDVDDAIRAAGAQALTDLLPECAGDRLPEGAGGVLPAVVTVLAADDALVTVPAPLAWQFTCELIELFNRAMAASEAVAELTADGGVLPTLTAGIVFSHLKEPIETAITAAADTMRLAKRAHPRQAAVGWTDLTHPGARADHAPLQWLTGHRRLLDRLCVEPASARTQWERDLDDARAESIPEERLAAFLHTEFTRTGRRALAEAALPTADLARLLSAARWWRSTPAEQTDEGGRP